MGIMKNLGTKELAKTIRDKARIAIPIDIMMMYQEINNKEEIYY